MIGAGLGRAVLGLIGLALGFALARDGRGGAADGAAESSICSTPAISDVLKISGFDKIIPMFSSRDDAMKAFAD
jgi:hypothetical protein